MSAETLNDIIDVLLKLYIVSVIFAMGLTLTTGQIGEQIRRYALMGKALLANIVVVPLAAALPGWP